MPFDSAILDSQATLTGDEFASDRRLASDSKPHHRETTLRVLHVVNGEHYAGAERVQDWLALSLPKLGIDVAFACVKPDRFPSARRCQSTPLSSVQMHNRFDLRAAWRLARMVRAEHFDLIHTHTPRTALVGHLAARLAEVPHVHHVHGHTASEVGNGWLKRVSAHVERLSLSRASAVIAVSPSAARYIHAWGVSRDRIHLVPNGVPGRKNVRRPTPSGTWTLGMIALLRPRKGLEVLLQTIAILQKQNVPVRLRVIGRFESPQYEKQVKHLVEQLNIEKFVEWRGFRQDIEAELDELDLAILPSVLPEGMPMVVLEAMAAGVPTIGSRVDGIADVIQDGVDGLLVNPEDPQDLARSIADVVNAKYDWQSFSKNCISNHAQKFSDAAMAAGVAEVYRQVLNQ